MQVVPSRGFAGVPAGDHAPAEERARFLKETEAAAAIDHRGVVQVHEVGTRGGRS